MSAPNLKPMSVEEYLRTEESSPFKREYVGGYVYPLHGEESGDIRGQAGASDAHVRIGVNFAFALYEAAERAGCQLYTSDMKLKLVASRTYYYPDVMVVCAEQTDERATERTDPCLLVEITSGSTASTDRLAKYAAYTAIPSLQTYLIVEQDRRLVYAYQRGPAGWTSTELHGQGDIDVPCLGISLSLDQIYRGLKI